MPIELYPRPSRISLGMDYKQHIRIQEDFPKAGISFKDISPLLSNGEAFSSAIAELKDIVAPLNPDIIIGPEARGFVVGAPLAYALGKGFLMARKKGKLPGKTIAKTYELEYGTDTLEIPAFGLKKGTRVVLADDLMATGGTLAVLESMLKEEGIEVVGIVTLIELTDLNGKDKVSAPFFSLVKYPH